MTPVRDEFATQEHACLGGWVLVPESYAVLLHPMPPEPPEYAGDDERAGWAKQVTDVTLRRAASASSVYPCQVCAPDLFVRWADGHYAAGHRCGDSCPHYVKGRR